MPSDLLATRQRILSGEWTASRAVEDAIARAQSPAGRDAFVFPRFDEARAEAARFDRETALAVRRPLAGLPFSVKDLFDVEGQVTAAGSRVLADHPAATADCPAVARLRAAGGSLIGRTHMVEFAFSGMGTNPHVATPAAWDGRHDRPVGSPDTPRVPGGSSSGAAVSVATGAAFIGLGSDTGGSIRIPAALNGIVGFKNTASRVPTAGAVPLSTTLDTVCALTRSVRDAILAHEILAARTVTRSPAPLSAYRLAVARTVMLDALEPAVARAFERSLAMLARVAGAQIDEIDLNETAELAGIQATGGFSAAESYAWHRELLATRANDYDPRVATRIRRGATMMAHEYLDLLQARQRWIRSMELALRGYDAVLSPTVPILGPLLAEVAPATGTDPAADAARDEAFFRANALLLRNTSVVNMLDGCALSLPCHTPDELPVGLMIWHGAGRDDTVLNLGLRIEEILQIQ
jgi:aspartyl-tRNA(Asn)/glutamyl-tRNA(Gln) amidotransferase subunit A